MRNDELIADLEKAYSYMESTGESNSVWLEVISRLRKAEGLAEALDLILPLAKGYAHQNKVGSNGEYVATASSALTAWRQDTP